MVDEGTVPYFSKRYFSRAILRSASSASRFLSNTAPSVGLAWRWSLLRAVVTAGVFLRFPSVALGAFEGFGVTAWASEAVGDDVVGAGGGIGQRLSGGVHGTGLWVVFGGVEVEIEEVFGCIFAEAQLAGGGGLRAAHVSFFAVFGVGIRLRCGASASSLVGSGVEETAFSRRSSSCFISDDLAVFASVEAVPAVSFGIPAKFHVFH